MAPGDDPIYNNSIPRADGHSSADKSSDSRSLFLVSILLRSPGWTNSYSRPDSLITLFVEWIET